MSITLQVVAHKAKQCFTKLEDRHLTLERNQMVFNADLLLITGKQSSWLILHMCVYRHLRASSQAQTLRFLGGGGGGGKGARACSDVSEI